jgi:hypothetical protein
MSAPMRPPTNAVPTLTDVVGFDSPVSGPVDEAGSLAAPPTAAVLPLRAGLTVSAETPRSLFESTAAIDEDQLVQRVLVDVQRQVDRMFEFRVREAIGPAFARLLEGFLQETRHDLELTLRDVVRRAVAQELARHRPR